MKKKEKNFFGWLWDLEFNIYGIPKPTTVFFLNMPPKYALKLMEERKNKFTDGTEKDIHERDESHIIDSYNAACNLVDTYNWCEIKCIENEQIKKVEDIHEEIFEKVKENI